MTHGFYAFMGGLAVRIPKHLPKFSPYDTSVPLSIDAAGLEYLFGQEHKIDVLLNLSEKEIQSKSKANGLTKTIVCIQALWFITQCFTRCKCNYIPEI